MSASAAERRALAEAARRAVDQLGSQRAVADSLGLKSTRMIRHMLAGDKGFNRADQLEAIAAGDKPPAVERRKQGLRQPVERIGGTAQYESQARQREDRLTLNATARGVIERAARRGGRVSMRFEYTTPAGQRRTGTLYRRGGHSASAVSRALDAGLTLGDLVDDQGTSDPPPAGSVVTSVVVTAF